MKADPKYESFPPRIVHNKLLLDAFLARRKIVSQWPPVVEQAGCVIVRGLFPGGFNPSLIRFKGSLLMTYRYHPGATASTRLAVAELDEAFNVVSNQPLEINDHNLSHEDARLIDFGDDLYIVYVSSNWPRSRDSRVKMGCLETPGHWRCPSVVDCSYKQPQRTEKNFVPFIHNSALHIIYRHGPQQIIWQPRGGEWITPPLRWPYGEIRGGTVPVAYEGKLLKFFHSRLNNEMPPNKLRYCIGAMLMEPEPPFQMLAVSQRPILRGSEAGGDDTRRFFKKNVVFPLGCVAGDGVFYLSIGINDSQSAIAKIAPKDLNL